MRREYRFFRKSSGKYQKVMAKNKKEVVAIAASYGDKIKMSDVSCPSKKEHRIDLVSHWCGFTLSLYVTLEAKHRLFWADNPIDEINVACDRIADGFPSRVLSYSQYLKIKNFFGKDDNNYFDKVVF